MKHDVTLKEFELVYRILSSVGENFSHGAGRSCQFYNVIGALILHEIFKVKARPVMGAAFIVVAETKTLVYAGREEAGFYSSEDAFHCWIETPNNILDFTSPEYSEAEKGKSSSVPRKMFQKAHSEMCENLNALLKPGDFFFCENTELTTFMLRRMFSVPMTHDLAKVCLDWALKSKKKIIPQLGVMDDLGEITQIKLKKGCITGAW